jgi:hypothetical protein
MTTPPVQVERRVGQRFPYLLPLSLRQISSVIEGVGFTQDVSSRGVFFFTDAPLQEGAEIELTLRMPSEITLGENMLVRCRGRILRIVRPVTSVEAAAIQAIESSADRPAETGAQAKAQTQAQTKVGVAVRFDCYEYLPECAEASASYARVAALHRHPKEDSPAAVSTIRPVLG